MRPRLAIAELLRRFFYGAAVVLVLAIVITMLSRGGGERTTTFVTVGTGSVDGLYYPLGGAVAKLVNRKRREYGFRLVVESTEGSRHNLAAVLDGEIELGIVQGDLEYEAVHGEGEWFVKGPQDTLRAVASLHQEAFTLLATDTSGISRLADLRGRRVAIGAAGAGQRANALALLAAVGLDPAADLEALETRPEEAVEALRQGAIDAMFYTVGHPNRLIEQATRGAARVHFVAIPPELLRDQHPYYVPATIRADLYPGVSNRTDVATVGLSAVLVTAERVDERIVYAVALNLFESLDELRSLHPAFAGIKEAEMLHGFAAPLHPGALRYYRQAGLLGGRAAGASGNG